ncbi:MAG: hypothetical protein WC547_08220 [Candidatus Omnitrophota bacterium]
MRLEGIKRIIEANAFLERYLPVFNKQFGVMPKHGDDMHRQIPACKDMDAIRSVRTPRALRNDFTIVHAGTLYRIEDKIRADKVIVEERLNGAILITHKSRSLRYSKILQRPVKIQEPRKQYKLREHKIDSYSNPWRLFRLPGSHETRLNKEILEAVH